MRRSSAAARHMVWLLGTLSLLILPLLSAALPGWCILPRLTLDDAAPAQSSAAPAAVHVPPWRPEPLTQGGQVVPEAPAAPSGTAGQSPADHAHDLGPVMIGC